MSVTQELKDDHKVLSDELGKIQQYGIVSEEGRKHFFSLKEKLLAHLNKGDEKIYPILEKAAENDTVLKGQLDAFRDEMKDISKKAMDFFAKYEEDTRDPSFASDLAGLIALLKSRIRKEEMILYKRFDEISG
ncbi:MAG: hemerythrin domain-containing protein [Nanobdellota archaeon]